MDSSAADTAPAALNDLIAAGLVSHEVIGDPARLGAEAETLRTLCGLVAGPVWRIDAFHYAFRAQLGDLGGRLGAVAPEAWSATLEAALQAALGPDAIWVSPADILAGGPALDLEAPLLLLRAQAAAVEGALGPRGSGPEGPLAAPPELQAVINAGYAAEVARLTAGAVPGGVLDARLAAIETALDTALDTGAGTQAQLAALAAAAPDPEALATTIAARIETTIDTAVETAVGSALIAGLGTGLTAGLARLETSVNAATAAMLEEVLRRLDAQEAAIRAQAAETTALAAGLAELAAAAPADDFRETVGLTLAEFLARIETRAMPLPARLS